VPPRITQGREYRRSWQGLDDAQFIRSITFRVKQLLGLDCSMANLDLAAPSTAILYNLQDFHFVTRASMPSRNQLRKSSQTANNPHYSNSLAARDFRERVPKLTRPGHSAFM
jgi:hypothetical protein